MRLQQTLEKYVPLISNMLMPLFIYGLSLIIFLLYNDLSRGVALFCHWGFYIISLLGLLILLNFNQSKPLFLIVISVVSYTAINYLKNWLGSEFHSNIWFKNIAVVIPYNLLFFYLFPKHKFICKQSLILLMMILIEYSFCEFLGRVGIDINIQYKNINIMVALGFCALIITALYNAIKDGMLYDYVMLFSSLSIATGLFFSATVSGLSLFFFISQLLLIGYLIYMLIYNNYYDDTTGFFSRNSYLLQSKHFPLKYSLGIVSIDNYDKLQKTIGVRRQNIVNGLIADVINSMSSDETIYRYAPEQFIILYKKLDKKEAFAQLEELRRTIASLEFEYSPNQRPLKLTVSCSVAEKKRSDIDAIEVLMRADKAMRKTLKFSHNVTSQG